MSAVADSSLGAKLCQYQASHNARRCLPCRRTRPNAARSIPDHRHYNVSRGVFAINSCRLFCRQAKRQTTRIDKLTHQRINSSIYLSVRAIDIYALPDELLHLGRLAQLAGLPQFSFLRQTISNPLKAFRISKHRQRKTKRVIIGQDKTQQTQDRSIVNR
eukprot:1159623-Rhodomonas_salina.1